MHVHDQKWVMIKGEIYTMKKAWPVLGRQALATIIKDSKLDGIGLTSLNFDSSYVCVPSYILQHGYGVPVL